LKIRQLNIPQDFLHFTFDMYLNILSFTHVRTTVHVCIYTHTLVCAFTCECAHRQTKLSPKRTNRYT